MVKDKGNFFPLSRMLALSCCTANPGASIASWGAVKKHCSDPAVQKQKSDATNQLDLPPASSAPGQVILFARDSATGVVAEYCG